MPHSITIASTTIHQDDAGRYYLNDLHRAAGGHNRHRPSIWLENKQTRALIAELNSGEIPAIQSKQQLGTSVLRELVYCYAMWISPAFQIKVIRAFDTLVVEKKDVLVLATENGHLKDMVASRDAIIAAKDGVIMGLQDKLIGSQGRQIRLVGQVAAMQKRQHDREMIQLIERMEAEGRPREEIAAVTGKPFNYIRQRIFIARQAGRLNDPNAVQGELSLGGAA